MLHNFIRQSQPWIKNIKPVKCSWHRYNRPKIRLCDTKLCDNIDSHDNSLYHESLYKKKNNYKYKNEYTIQSVVDDYNKRWNKNITVEEYYKNFK